MVSGASPGPQACIPHDDKLTGVVKHPQNTAARYMPTGITGNTDDSVVVPYNEIPVNRSVIYIKITTMIISIFQFIVE